MLDNQGFIHYIIKVNKFIFYQDIKKDIDFQ